MSRNPPNTHYSPERATRWLPIGILSASALVTASIFPFGPSYAVADCSGALSSDFACYQERYQDLVRVPGVETAFDELKEGYEKNKFVRFNCHQLSHVIGLAAAERYGDVQGTYPGATTSARPVTTTGP